MLFFAIASAARAALLRTRAAGLPDVASFFASKLVRLVCPQMAVRCTRIQSWHFFRRDTACPLRSMRVARKPCTSSLEPPGECMRRMRLELRLAFYVEERVVCRTQTDD